MNLGARIINPTTARYDDEDDIGCSDRPARHVPAFDFFFRPYSLPRARPLSQSARSHTFQLHIPFVRSRESGHCPSHPIANGRGRGRSIILASVVRPSNAVHSRTHSHSHSHCSAESSTAFPLSLSPSESSLSLPSSASFRWMTLSLRDRERGKY